jgi:Domain of unknown function (DUF4276)
VNTGARPPLGFVCEGAGEHATFPSLVSRIVNAVGFSIPCVNTEGYGGILKNLEEHLDDLTLSDHPYTIVVGIDLRDVIRAGLFPDCVTLRLDLDQKISTWLQTRTRQLRLQPLPNRIVTVVQVQQFESWWLADPDGLSRCGLFSIDVAGCTWTNVDAELANPASWLKERQKTAANLKSPAVARAALSRSNVSTAAAKSRSFRKFRKEVARGYGEWMAALIA